MVWVKEKIMAWQFDMWDRIAVRREGTEIVHYLVIEVEQVADSYHQETGSHHEG